jgi:hypothetical protein
MPVARRGKSRGMHWVILEQRQSLRSLGLAELGCVHSSPQSCVT